MEDILKNQQIPLTRVTDPKTGQVYYSPQATIYNDRTQPITTILKDVIVDQANSSISASYALTASYALNSGGGGGSTSTGSLLTTASFLSPNLTFTKGDTTTFDVSLATLTVTNAYTASYINGGEF